MFFKYAYDFEVFLVMYKTWTIKVWQDGTYPDHFNIIALENGTGEIKADIEFEIPVITKINGFREPNSLFAEWVEIVKRKYPKRI